MKDKNGFTLIELLAVIIILGILMIIAIPSVTNYIQNSRKEAYVKTSQNMVRMMTNEINTGKYPVYDTDITYYFPVSCLKTETGGESPYGDWKERYVAVTYDGTSFDYYWTSLDEAGMGIYLSYSELLDVDLIYSDVKDLQLFIGVGNRTKILKFGDSCDPKDYSEVPLDSSISDKSLFIPDDINYDDVLYTSQFDSNNNINNKMKSIAGGSLSNITSIKYNATIPEGVEKITGLGFDLIEDLTIPSTLEVLRQIHPYYSGVYSKVKKLHFKGCKTICNCEFNEKLEVIEVPKGSLAHYREQFPDYQDKIIEV